jgi:hypothetical protein
MFKGRGSTLEVPGQKVLREDQGYGHCAASVPTGKMVEDYEANVLHCWNDYKSHMDSIEKDWCDWTMISR